MSQSSSAPRAYQVKVTLLGTRPPVWRRLLVRDDTTLAMLHRILQLAMGWSDSHMHQFLVARSGRGRSGPPVPVESNAEESTRLVDVISKTRPRMLYEYDFGDGWEHGIELEDIVPGESSREYPWVLAGKRACPPEDVGGLPGFAHFLDVMANPRHPEHREFREWFAQPYDPAVFDADEINRMFHGGSQ